MTRLSVNRISYHLRCLPLWLLVFASFCSAADAPPTLVVSRPAVQLYTHQDEASAVVATLKQGEKLIPLAQGIGPVSWYMVRTANGEVGWVRASDVTAGYDVSELFKESMPSGPVYTWSAVTSTGRTFSGSFTAEADPTTGNVSGSWSLRDNTGKNVMGGVWSANKVDKGWSGSWRAAVSGQNAEFSGTWSTNHRFPASARFADLFEAAVKEVIGGDWRSGAYSGSWSFYRPG
jgi:hypothetical protein